MYPTKVLSQYLTKETISGLVHIQHGVILLVDVLHIADRVLNALNNGLSRRAF